MHILARLDRGDGGADVRTGGKDTAKVVAGEFKDRDAACREVLLVADVLIAGDEDVEFGFGQADEVAVPDGVPAAFLRRRAGVAGPAACAWARGRTRPEVSSCGREQGGFGAFQNIHRHAAGNRRETLQKFVEGVVAFEVVEEGLHRNTRALEHGRAAENLRVNGDEVGRIHAATIAIPRPRVNLREV